MPIRPDHLVDDIMRRWPATIRVFLDHRMRCVGCPIACFHTVEDACREHESDLGPMLAVLRTAAGADRAALPGQLRIDPIPHGPPQ